MAYRELEMKLIVQYNRRHILSCISCYTLPYVSAKRASECLKLPDFRFLILLYGTKMFFAFLRTQIGNSIRRKKLNLVTCIKDNLASQFKETCLLNCVIKTSSHSDLTVVLQNHQILFDRGLYIILNNFRDSMQGKLLLKNR